DMTITPVCDDVTGEIVNYIAIKQDITARKQAEAQIATYSEQLRARTAEMESDLEMAREVQQALLPQQYPSFPA
ncbi:MAG: hypothetical protein GWN87_19655, partial [Desulfuromonadales bacterium]|nr:hypothetical protein [Desulfuromonadales bacterium]